MSGMIVVTGTVLPQSAEHQYPTNPEGEGLPRAVNVNEEHAVPA